jgi:hypothetical protein
MYNVIFENISLGIEKKMKEVKFASFSSSKISKL